MRVKIRGLVFVGFAAAVFAQSAMADANDAKTVTSKLYVDTKFQDQSNRVESTTGLTSTDWQSTVKYPSMAVLNEVKSQVSDIDVVSGNETYVSVTEGTGDNAGTFTVNTAQAPATANTGITGTLTTTTTTGGVTTPGTEDALVTAKAVKSLIDTGLSDASGDENDTTMPTSLAVVSYAEKKANKATAIVTSGTGQNNTSNTAYPTTKAVYDFVTTQGGNFQPKVDEAAATTMYVGKYVPSDGNTPASATWDKLTTGTYVSNTSTTAGTYTLDVPAAKITSATSDFAASGDTRAKLATAGAVYDFVTTQGGNFQPKDTQQATADSVRIGYNSNGSTPGWGNLTGATNGYVAISGSGADYTVDIPSAQIANSIAANSGSSAKLATEGAVYNFVTTGYQPVAPNGVKVGNNGGWDTLAVDTAYLGLNTATSGTVQVTVNTATTSAGISGASASNSTGANNLTTAYAVNAYVQSVLHGNEIPAMPEACTTAANNGGYCALVYGDADDTQSGVQAGLMWTVMAPVPTTGG